MKKITSVLLGFLSFTSSAAPVFAATTFSDMNAGYQYAASVEAFASGNVITGYPDGTFRPFTMVNRAELLTLIYRTKNLSVSTPTTKRCFPDVPASAWYASYVCAAKDANVVKGYPDGTFHPEQSVNLVEAAKIVSILYALELPAAHSGEAWYVPFLGALSDGHFLPPTFTWVGESVTRGELVEMLYRIRENTHDRDSVELADLDTRECASLRDEANARFDTARIREVWFDWFNEARAKGGLPPYVENAYLNRTSSLWARTMRDRGDASHRRKTNEDFYDNASIGAWFSAQGIETKMVGNATVAETIGWNTMFCKEIECTDELIVALRPLFDLYMAEANQQPGTFDRSHYESVMHPSFRLVGMGFALSGNKVLMATHYATAITSDPPPVCK